MRLCIKSFRRVQDRALYLTAIVVNLGVNGPLLFGGGDVQGLNNRVSVLAGIW